MFDAASSPLAILRTLAHQPRLLAPFLGWAAALAGHGALPRRESELLALRTAWNCRSAYEWGHHAVYARSAGLSDEEIERVAIGPAASAWSARDRALLAAADELHARQQLSEAAWSALRAQWGDAQLVEIPLVIGHYTMLSMLANASGVPLEPGLPVLPAGPGR
ncbi:MAG: carboxymuconolactone decarboxylase family protein [Myxococcota bacterium]